MDQIVQDFIVCKGFYCCDLMIKSITCTGISRANTVEMRPHPGATTVDICNDIKL